MDGVRTRVYVPRASGALPVLVYFHGGGWAIRAIPRTTIASVAGSPPTGAESWPRSNYRSPRRSRTRPASTPRSPSSARCAPTRPRSTGNPARVAVGGDSAGGNLAAAACLRLRDLGEPLPAFQVLLYPALDLRCLAASYHALGEGYLLTKGSISWYLGHYGAKPDPRASVLLEPDLGSPPRSW